MSLVDGGAELLYQSDLATVVCADAREYLGSLGVESIDCVVTDPPYGVAWRSNSRRERFSALDGDATVESAVALLADVTPDLVRVTRRSRHLYTFGLAMDHHLLSVKADLVWDKGRFGGGDLSQAWGPSHEVIYFHVRAADRCNADRQTGTLAARLRRGSVISIKRLSARQVRRHPTEKPVGVMAMLIESSTLQGDLVLDPFAGSGATGVAALSSGRRVVLVEKDRAYAEIAASRCREAEALAHQMAQL